MDKQSVGDDELEIGKYFAVLWRRKFIIVATMLVCAMFFYMTAKDDPRTYRASADVLLQSSTSESVLSAESNGAAPSRSAVQTQIALMESRGVRDAVVDELGYSPAITIAQVGETDVVSISSSASSPRVAAENAQTYAETYVEFVRFRHVADLLDGAEEVQKALDEVRAEIAEVEAPLIDYEQQVLEAATFEEQQEAQNRLAAAQSSLAPELDALRSRESAYLSQLDSLNLAAEITTTGGAQIISDAQAPANPSSPRPKRSALTGAAFGLVLGVILAFVRENLDSRVRREDDITEEVPGLTVLATVPSGRFLHRKVDSTDESSRRLRAAVQTLGDKSSAKVLVVTSSGAHDARDRGMVVANLATALARVGNRVVAVGSDVHRPGLHEAFGLSNEVGLSSYLAGDVPLSDASRLLSGTATLAVITSGPRRADAADLLATDKMRETLEALKAEHDFVIIETAPVTEVSDALVLATRADGVLLVVRAHQTRRKSLVAAVSELLHVGAPVSGAVLTGVSRSLWRRKYESGPRDLIGIGAPSAGFDAPVGRSSHSSTDAAEPQTART